MADDDLSGFERGAFTHAGTTHQLLRCGSGPAVIVIAEMPGITPKVLAFARMVAGIGCSAVLPVLFGEAGRDPVPRMPNPLAALIYAGDSILRACISREFTVWATGRSSPVVDWLRALAVFEHERCGGPGVGAVGRCFTGGYALAMATHPVVLVPVLSQPSLPLPLTSEQRRSIDISRDELGQVKHRCAHDGLQVIGLRFKTDRFVPAQRFAFLRDQLGDAFIAVELEDSDANPAATLPAHSVLTEHLINEPGQPTRKALELVLDHFRKRLLFPKPAPSR
jgi:dienelactone hydrolase